VKRLSHLVVLFAALFPTVARAQSLSSIAPAPRFSDTGRVAKLAAAFPEIDRLMTQFAERSRVPGIAYGVIIDGKVAHIGVHGLRDAGTNAPVDSVTVFRIASMTKSYTAAAILQLRDAGRLSLEDPAEKHVPELKSLRRPTSDARPITIRDLLTHSAGFPEDNPWGDQQLAATDAELAAMLTRGIPFSNTPGVAYEYSNLGFALLGRIVANVSGMTYDRYVTERIFHPLGMTSTYLQATAVPAARLAHGFRLQDDRWLEEPQLPHGAFGAMGGMLTSIADLSKWVAFMLDAWPPRDGADNAVLSRSSRREMQQVARYSGGSAVRSGDSVTLSAGGYAYGLGVRQTCLFRISVAHSGGLPGFGSVMRWLPDHGVGIVALGNLTYTGWGGVVEQSLQAMARTGGLVAREPQPAPVLLTRQGQVTRLLTSWNAVLADSLAAMNLYLDQSKPRRQAAYEKIVAQAGGSCRPEGSIVAENALRGEWRLRCATGDLRVTITLAPTEPAGVQQLDVAPMRREDSLMPAAVCR